MLIEVEGKMLLACKGGTTCVELWRRGAHCALCWLCAWVLEPRGRRPW